MRPTLAAMALSISVLASGGPALAGPKEDLERAEQLYARLSYDEANRLAVAVTKQRGLSHDVLVRAWRVAGITHGVLGRHDLSRDAFIMLLTYEADYQADPNLGPKVTTPFFEARGFWRGQPAKPGIDASPAVRAKDGGALRVNVRDPSHIVREAHVGWRWGPAGGFTTKVVPANDPVSVEVSAAPAAATRFDYYVQAIDDKENVVLESGSPTSPRSTTVEAPPSGAAPSGAVATGPATERGGKSVLSSPVFWGIVGAAAVGGGAALFFATRPPGEANAVSFSPALRCGGSACQ